MSRNSGNLFRRGEEAKILVTVKKVRPRDLAGVVDPIGSGITRLWHHDRGVAAIHVPQEDGVLVAEYTYVRSRDLAGIVDPIGKGRGRAGHLERAGDIV